MFRKLVIALGATALIGAAALAPTAASANFKGKGIHHHFRGGLGIVVAGPTVDDDDCYIKRETVWTKHGPRVHEYEVCD